MNCKQKILCLNEDEGKTIDLLRAFFGCEVKKTSFGFLSSIKVFSTTLKNDFSPIKLVSYPSSPEKNV
jgi:hypothetical protein